MLIFGIVAFFLGLVVLIANSAGYSPNAVGIAFGYFLMLVGGLFVNLGIVGKFLVMTSKAIIEGLNGNINTESLEKPSAENYTALPWWRTDN